MRSLLPLRHGFHGRVTRGIEVIRSRDKFAANRLRLQLPPKLAALLGARGRSSLSGRGHCSGGRWPGGRWSGRSRPALRSAGR